MDKDTIKKSTNPIGITCAFVAGLGLSMHNYGTPYYSIEVLITTAMILLFYYIGVDVGVDVGSGMDKEGHEHSRNRE